MAKDFPSFEQWSADRDAELAVEWAERYAPPGDGWETIWSAPGAILRAMRRDGVNYVASFQGAHSITMKLDDAKMAHYLAWWDAGEAPTPLDGVAERHQRQAVEAMRAWWDRAKGV